MRGLEKNCMKRDRQTDIHTYNGHRNSMIESAQWADSMKNPLQIPSKVISLALSKILLFIRLLNKDLNWPDETRYYKINS